MNAFINSCRAFIIVFVVATGLMFLAQLVSIPVPPEASRFEKLQYVLKNIEWLEVIIIPITAAFMVGLFSYVGSMLAKKTSERPKH